MKNFLFILFGFCIFSLPAAAQDMTIILVRHAEKDVSAAASKTNPGLTEAGRRRAERLFEFIKPFQPEYIFSTTFKRTLETAVPSAEKLIPNYRMQIQFYDYTELESFAAKVLKLKTKSVLIVGHHLINEELANLLIGKKKYEPFGDNEYGKAIVIKIKGKKIEDKIVEY